MELIGISGRVSAALRGDAVLNALIGDRFFPVVAIQGVNGYPFVTYRNLGVGSSSENKDAYGDLSGKIEITVAAETFASVSSTSEEIKRVLESADDDVEFVMTNYEEEFDIEINAYVSVLTFDYDED